MHYPPRIFLIGFMGSGKSYHGRQLAELLGYAFTDLDERITEAAGMSIPDIFSRQGEEGFRKIERRCLHATARLSAHVIACGGGAPCFFDNMAWIKAHGLSIFLDPPQAVLIRRLQPEQQTRPLLRNLSEEALEHEIREKLHQRRPFYEQAAIIIHEPQTEIILQEIDKWVVRCTSFIGVDYGSKLAGTTVLAYYDVQQGSIRFARCAKGEDADRFLENWIAGQPIRQVFLDAPLSLPGVYTQPDPSGDYFYRQGDRELQAMSPMFLGGLTARAMRLKALLSRKGVSTQEVYPGALARLFGLGASGYKKKDVAPEALSGSLQGLLPSTVCWEEVKDWHAFDALLAFLSGWRYLNNIHQSAGAPEEGIIII